MPSAMPDRRVLLVGAVAIGWAVACGGLWVDPPVVSTLYVSPGTCGTWTATIDATGHGDVLVLTAGGQVVRTFTVDGFQSVTATGTGTPGRALQFEAKIGTSSKQVIETLPPIDATMAVSPPGAVVASGTPAAVDVLVSTPCKLGGPTVRAELRAAADPSGVAVWTSTAVPILPGAGAHVVVPAPAQGLYVLSIDAVTGDVPLGHQTERFYWGTAEDDLDKDGFVGALDGNDCDDHNARVNPGRSEPTEVNGIDDNCDGRVDEGTVAYDDDGDGVTELQGDCDDADPTRYPAAVETADCRDQNCNGQVDEGVVLLAEDDAYEPDDARDHAHDLGTQGIKSFDQKLTIVTHGADDEEWFSFYSDDGDWDAWGIDASAIAVPDGGVYDVSIERSGGRVVASERLSDASHPEVQVFGAALRDDSGTYLLHLKPVKVKTAWCPLTIRLQSF